LIVSISDRLGWVGVPGCLPAGTSRDGSGSGAGRPALRVHRPDRAWDLKGSALVFSFGTTPAKVDQKTRSLAVSTRSVTGWSGLGRPVMGSRQTGDLD
jgi:hypothetical protein